MNTSKKNITCNDRAYQCNNMCHFHQFVLGYKKDICTEFEWENDQIPSFDGIFGKQRYFTQRSK